MIVALAVAICVLNLTVNTSDSLAPLFITLTWGSMAALGLLIPRYSQVFLTLFFVVISAALFLVMRISGIVIKFADTGIESYRHIDRLIQDILDDTKISEGKVQLVVKPNDLQHILALALDHTWTMAEHKELALVTEIDEGVVAEKRLCDEVRVVQIISNLLTNAIKFTDKGSVTLRVTAGSGDDIVFSVVDTGVGIPSDKIDTIFNVFEQAKPSRYREQRGSGLGLPIVKNLVNMMGGSIDVQSTEGKGSSFTVTLPLPAKTAIDAA